MGKTFMQRFKEGLLKDPYDALHEAIDEWHASDSNLPIWEYLGMTRDEYKLSIEEPSVFLSIIKNR